MIRLFVFAAAALVPAFAAARFLFTGPQAIALYPLAFLFLFRAQETPAPRRAFLFLASGSALAFSGILLDRFSLLWIGSFWNFLGICSLGGFHFVFPAPLLIFACPPLSAFSSIIAGFELRMWLSQISARILSVLDPSSSAAGNLIHFRGTPYAVDRVCEGMKMAVAAFLVSAVLARSASPRGRLLIVLIAPGLWLFANLVRILSLVVFQIPSEQAGHEIIGLVFFACMIVFPLWLLAALFARTETPSVSQLRRIPSAAGILLAIVGLASVVRAPNEERIVWPVQIAGYSQIQEETRENGRIVVYRRADNSLILKNNPFAPGTAHDPRICFEAAGFVFQQTGNETVDTFALRSARVEKDGHPARLLWWYAWDDARSDSDLDWRLARMRGRRVIQYNLYGTDDAALRAEAARLLREEIPP